MDICHGDIEYVSPARGTEESARKKSFKDELIGAGEDLPRLLFGLDGPTGHRHAQRVEKACKSLRRLASLGYSGVLNIHGYCSFDSSSVSSCR